MKVYQVTVFEHDSDGEETERQLNGEVYATRELAEPVGLNAAGEQIKDYGVVNKEPSSKTEVVA